MAVPDFIFIGDDSGTEVNSGNITYDDVLTSFSNVPGWRIDETGEVKFDVSSQSYTSGWLNTIIDIDYQDADRPILELRGPTTALLRLAAINTVSSTGGTQRLEYYNGTAWVSAGTLTTNLQSGDNRVDIRWIIANTGGEFTVYVNGAQEASFTGDTLLTADTTIDEIAYLSADASAARYTDFGPLIVDSVDTRGLEWDQSVPTSQGQYDEWSNGEASVDDYMFATNWQLSSAVGSADGQRCTLNFAAISASLSAYAVETVLMLIGGTAQSEPSFYVKPHVRISTTDYQPTGSKQLPSGGTVARAVQIDLDPSTGSQWASQAAVEAAQMGWEIDISA